MSIPSLFARFVDDAAIFPPGLAPLDRAVVEHVAHRAAAYADLVGPLVVDTARVDELAALAPAGTAVSVVVATSAEIADVVARAAAAGVVLASLEVRLGGPQPLAAQVAEAAAGAPADVTTYVEVPRPTSPDWPDVLDAVATHGLRLKFRTGGTEAAAFPTEDELATWISAAVARGLPFKCTAGLHHAVRHTAEVTGFEHHGYLNLLLATAQAAAGHDHATLAATLGRRDGDAVVAATRSTPGLETARALFTSYGSCSVIEPYEDLATLGLLS